MLKLNFNLRHQAITLLNPGTIVATDSKNYLVANFNFISDDWEYPLTAVFTSDVEKIPYTILVGQSEELEENECFIPWEVLQSSGNVYVSVFCGDLHTTNTVKFKVVKSGYTEGEIPPPPTPTIYEQILQALDNKQPMLTAGQNINISDENVISAQVTDDYEQLNNKPSINNVTLSGNKSSDDLNLQGKLTAGNNITINNGVISAESGGVTSYNDLTDLPILSIVEDSDDYPIVTKTLKNLLKFNVKDFLGFIPDFENEVTINLSPFVMKYQNANPRSEEVGVWYIYDFNGLIPYQNGIFRINENAQYYPARNFPAALNDIDRTKSYFILQAFSPSYESGNASGYMLRKVYGRSSSGECLEFSQIAHIVKRGKGTWQVDSQTDWAELTGGGSQIVSGAVNANGTITFTDSDGNTFTTTGSSVIGADGFSPVATVTQTASGATVSITDSTGTTTANISNGQDGNDYVLTAQDKSDIADIVLSELPTTQGVLYGNTSN